MIAASAARGLIEIGTNVHARKRAGEREVMLGGWIAPRQDDKRARRAPQQTYRAPAQEIGGNSAWVGACWPSHRLRMAIFAFPADVSRRCMGVAG